MIWLEILHVLFALEDTEVVHEGVGILTDSLRDLKWTYEWFCQLGAKMFGAIFSKSDYPPHSRLLDASRRSIVSLYPYICL